MQRFFCSNENLGQKEITITDRQEIYHLHIVLRIKPGAQIKVFNKHSQEIVGTVINISEQRLVLRKDYDVTPPKERFVDVILACAIPKKAKFEFIIEKCTELGIDEIIPLKTSRTEQALPLKRQEAKNLRYEKVAINAAKQSGRSQIPKIHPIAKFPDVLKTFGQDSFLLIGALSSPRKQIWDVVDSLDLSKTRKIVIFIGPEGDFTPDEISLAKTHGCNPVSLGGNILKVDTAAISCVSFINLYLDYATNKEL